MSVLNWKSTVLGLKVQQISEMSVLPKLNGQSDNLSVCRKIMGQFLFWQTKYMVAWTGLYSIFIKAITESHQEIRQWQEVACNN